MFIKGNKGVEVIRKRIIEVRIPGEDAMVVLETDDNGSFIRAYDGAFKPIDPDDKQRIEEDIPHGTLRVSHSSPYCIRYYDRWLRKVIKICSPGAVC